MAKLSISKAWDETKDVLGRDSVTINSGGEKIFAEEVEHALKQHPAVYDTVVAGRPSGTYHANTTVTLGATGFRDTVRLEITLPPGVARASPRVLAPWTSAARRYLPPRG